MIDETARSRRRALWGLAAGSVLVVVAGVLLVLRPTEAPAGLTVSDAGTLPVAAVSSVPGSSSGPSTTPAPISTPKPWADPSSRSSPIDSSSTATDPTLADTSSVPAPTIPAAPAVPTAVVAPVTVTVPSRDLSATIVPVGLEADGLMEVPSDVDTVGWYRFGPTPGDPVGSAVLTGHVDSADQGRGVFAELGLLAPGDLVEVTDADGVLHRFQVQTRESWPKDEVPLDRLFDRTGSGRLVLITCGGAFDPQALSYEENIAVTAVPVP